MSRVDITQLNYTSLEQASESLRKLSNVYEENLTRIKEIFDILISNNIFATDSGSTSMADAVNAGIREFTRYNEDLVQFASFLIDTNEANKDMDDRIVTIMDNTLSKIEDAI